MIEYFINTFFYFYDFFASVLLILLFSRIIVIYSKRNKNFALKITLMNSLLLYEAFLLWVIYFLIK